MNSQQNSQDEGFIPTKLVAKVSEKDDIRDSKGKECKMFSPCYLPPGQGAMKVQIPQAVQEIDEFFIEQEIQAQKKLQMGQEIRRSIKRNNSISVTPQHPYRFYEQNSMFELVYSKNSSDDPLNKEFQYIKNEIVLQTADIRENNPADGQKKTQVVNILRNPYSRLLRSYDSTPMSRNFSNKSQSSKTYSQLLTFDSRFQCGNLYCVYHKIDTNEYHLFLQNDTNSYGYNQWFYFNITNAKPFTQYNFVIVNLKKKQSFFKQGYQPIVFSLKKYEENGYKNGWYRSGYNIDYQESHILTSKFFKFYKLSFTLKFTHQNDYLLIAANLPYSFTRLSNYLDKFTKLFRISNQAQDEQIATLRVSPLGRTFCGNNLPQIKIIPKQQESTTKSPSKNKKKNPNKKKMIVFLARQHPGETVSSYLMENILNQLSSFGIQTQIPKQKESQQKVKFLLKNFTILIYPMINIDGVIYGNSRCDVSGMDLNRRWKNPSKVFHPQLFNIKNRLQTYSKKLEIVSCFDLHGHSKLYNVFCYSCKINPVTCRILPYLVSKQTKKFHFPSCTFGITRYKSTTARAAIYKIIQNENVLTIESSYFGFVQNKQQSTESSGQLRQSNKNKIVKYFQPKDFQQIAVSLLNGLEIFLNREEVKKFKEVQKQIRTNLREIQSYERQNHQGEQDSGSESDPEGDQIQFQVKIKTILGKQFLQQASCFLPAEEENIQIPQIMQSSITLEPNASNARLKTTERQENVQQEMKESLQKIQRFNKIRITKLKQEPKSQKITQIHKIRNDLNLINMNPKSSKIQNKKQKTSTSLYQKIKQTSTVPRQKKTVSTYQQNSVDKTQRLYSQNNQRSMFGSNKNHSQMRIHDDSHNQVKNSAQLPKFYDDLIIYSAQSKEIINMQKSNLLENTTTNQPSIFTDNHFFIKFKKFIPSNQIPSFNRKQKLSFLQESIYKDDQRQILHTLMENKRKLEKQKTKRELQKSATIGQRYSNKNSRHKNVWDEEIEAEQKMLRGYGLSDGRRRDEIVDFRKFKDRQRTKMQLRHANQVYIKFMKKESQN